MERIAVEIHAAQGLVADSATFFLPFGVEPGRDRQTGFRVRVPHEVDDGHPVEQGTASPIFGNEAAQAMLDLMPLARARRKRRDLDCEVKRSGHPLPCGFPQTHATAVTAAAIRRDIELRSRFV